MNNQYHSNENFKESIVNYFHFQFRAGSKSADPSAHTYQTVHMTLSIEFRKNEDVQKHSGVFPTDSQMLGFSHWAQYHRCDDRIII